jgi:hypothetical protein
MSVLNFYPFSPLLEVFHIKAELPHRTDFNHDGCIDNGRRKKKIRSLASHFAIIGKGCGLFLCGSKNWGDKIIVPGFATV